MVMGKHELKVRQGLLIGLLKLYPKCDPKWSAEERKEWWDGFTKMVAWGIELAAAEDELERDPLTKMEKWERELAEKISKGGT